MVRAHPDGVAVATCYHRDAPCDVTEGLGLPSELAASAASWTPCAHCRHGRSAQVDDLVGVRLGRNDRRVLLEAAPSGEPARVVGADATGASRAPLRRAAGKLRRLGLISTGRVAVERDVKRVGSWYMRPTWDRDWPTMERVSPTSYTEARASTPTLSAERTSLGDDVARIIDNGGRVRWAEHAEDLRSKYEDTEALRVRWTDSMRRWVASVYDFKRHGFNASQWLDEAAELESILAALDATARTG